MKPWQNGLIGRNRKNEIPRASHDAEGIAVHVAPMELENSDGL
jgi:hypothetical protein